MLRDRLLTAFVLIPIVLASAYLGGWALFAVLGLGFLLCGYEYFALLPAGGYRSDRALGLLLIALLLLDAFLDWNLAPAILLGLVVVPPFVELFRRDHTGFLNSWALTALGVVYIGLLGGYLFRLRALPRGEVWLLITLLTTWATDTLAYFAGHSLGRHPFFPTISPKKTWEGAIGGLLGAFLTYGILGSLFGVNPLLAFAGGLLIGVAGTVGDLAESLIKRQVGVKDSGSALLGHGGVFDRLDSTLFTLVTSYYLLLFALK